MLGLQSVYKMKTDVGKFKHNVHATLEKIMKICCIWTGQHMDENQSQILTASEVLLGLLLGLEECEFELWRALWLCEFSCGE